MNIGIITCWKPDDNYGTQIQCFALQTYLRTKGHNAFLIRYLRNNDQVKIPLAQRKLRNVINPIKIARVVYVRLLSKRLQKFGNEHDRHSPEFRTRYLNQTKDYPSIFALQECPPAADLYIVGSDQVWNINYRQINNIRAHFLNFGSKNTKRISYAASFGFDRDRLSKEYAETVLPFLKDFDGVSVREQSGIDICRKIGVENAIQVCDPTLLIEPEEYIECFEKEKICLPQEDYVLVYNLSATSRLNVYEIKQWAEKQQCKLVYITGHGKNDRIEKIYPTVPEWVYLIANAKYVITNSFHGAVFSLMFHRKLAVFPITGSAFGNPNARFDTLIKLAGKDFIVRDKRGFIQVFEDDINWDKFERNKAELVTIGRRFLEKYIN